MKRTVLCVFISSLVLASCGKDGDTTTPGNSGTITATIDGLPVSFNFNAKARHLTVAGSEAINITGYQGTGSSNDIGITIAKTGGVSAGYYSEIKTTTIGKSALNYRDASTGNTYISHESTTFPSTTTVSEITSTSIKGTFSGDIFLLQSGGVSTTKKTITNGTFVVNF